MSYANVLFGKGPLGDDPNNQALIIQQAIATDVGDRYKGIVSILNDLQADFNRGNLNMLKDYQNRVKGNFTDMMKMMQKLQGEENKKTALGHIRLLSEEFAYRFIK